ncbi:MAG: hypothetical protein E6740_01190 [Streptococcus parasanguinis]|nr:hypothetical protein [Streptococcus parasanguinis]
MKEILQQLTAVYSKLNSYYSEQLVDSEKISDVNDDINEDFQEDIENLARGIHLMEKLDIDTLKDANKQLYLNGMFDIYTSLLNFENYFADLREIHIQVSKKIRYLNGEITQEEYLDDGRLNVEVVDEEEDDAGNI